MTIYGLDNVKLFMYTPCKIFSHSCVRLFWIPLYYDVIYYLESMIVWLVIAVFGMNKNIIGASYSGQQQYT